MKIVRVKENEIILPNLSDFELELNRVCPHSTPLHNFGNLQNLEFAFGHCCLSQILEISCKCYCENMLYEPSFPKTKLSNLEKRIASHWERCLNLMYVEANFVGRVCPDLFEGFFFIFTDKRKAFF